MLSARFQFGNAGVFGASTERWTETGGQPRAGFFGLFRGRKPWGFALEVGGVHDSHKGLKLRRAFDPQSGVAGETHGRRTIHNSRKLRFSNVNYKSRLVGANEVVRKVVEVVEEGEDIKPVIESNVEILSDFRAFHSLVKKLSKRKKSMICLYILQIMENFLHSLLVHAVSDCESFNENVAPTLSSQPSLSLHSSHAQPIASPKLKTKFRLNSKSRNCLPTNHDSENFVQRNSSHPTQPSTVFSFSVHREQRIHKNHYHYNYFSIPGPNGFTKKDEKRSWRRKKYHYACVLNALCQEGKFDVALKLLAYMDSYHPKPDACMYDMVVRGLCIHGRVDDAEKFILLWDEKGQAKDILGDIAQVLKIFQNSPSLLPPPSPSLQDSSLYTESRCSALHSPTLFSSSPSSPTTHSRASNPKKVISKFFVAPKESDVNEITLNARKLEPKSKVKIVPEESGEGGFTLRDGSFSNKYFFLSLIDGYMRKKEFGKIIHLLESIEMGGTTPTIMMYNKALEACDKMGNADESLKILSRIENRKELLPQEYTYFLVISTLGKTGNLDKAKSILYKMKKTKNCKPTSQTYNIFLHNCSKAKNFKLALKVFGEMKEENTRMENRSKSENMKNSSEIQISKVEKMDGKNQSKNKVFSRTYPVINSCTYNTMIYCLSECGEYDKALSVYDEFLASGLPLDCFTVSEILKIYFKKEEAKIGLSHFFSMKKKINLSGDSFSFQPHSERAGYDLLVYNWALKLCILAKSYSCASTLCEEILANKFQMDEKTYRLMIRLQSKCGRADKAFRYFDLMLTQGIHPSKVTVCALLDACAISKTFQKAIDFFHQIKYFPNVEYDACLFNVMIKVCMKCRQGMYAKYFYQRMIAAGYKPDAATFSVYLPALESSNLSEEAVKTFEYMKVNGLLNGSFLYFWMSTILSTCTRNFDLVGALYVYKECKNWNVHFHTKDYMRMLAVCESNGAWKEAIWLLNEYHESLHAFWKNRLSKEWSSEPPTTTETETETTNVLFVAGGNSASSAFDYVIGACDAAGEAMEAWKVYQKMKQMGVNPSYKTHALIVQALRNGKLWKLAMEVYEQIPLFSVRERDNESRST